MRVESVLVDSFSMEVVMMLNRFCQSADLGVFTPLSSHLHAHTGAHSGRI